MMNQKKFVDLRGTLIKFEERIKECEAILKILSTPSHHHLLFDQIIHSKIKKYRFVEQRIGTLTKRSTECTNQLNTLDEFFALAKSLKLATEKYFEAKNSMSDNQNHLFYLKSTTFSAEEKDVIDKQIQFNNSTLEKQALPIKEIKDQLEKLKLRFGTFVIFNEEMASKMEDFFIIGRETVIEEACSSPENQEKEYLSALSLTSAIFQAKSVEFLQKLKILTDQDLKTQQIVIEQLKNEVKQHFAAEYSPSKLPKSLHMSKDKKLKQANENLDEKELRFMKKVVDLQDKWKEIETIQTKTQQIQQLHQIVDQHLISQKDINGSINALRSRYSFFVNSKKKKVELPYFSSSVEQMSFIREREAKVQQIQTEIGSIFEISFLKMTFFSFFLDFVSKQTMSSNEKN